MMGMTTQVIKVTGQDTVKSSPTSAAAAQTVEPLRSGGNRALGRFMKRQRQTAPDVPYLFVAVLLRFEAAAQFDSDHFIGGWLRYLSCISTLMKHGKLVSEAS